MGANEIRASKTVAPLQGTGMSSEIVNQLKARIAELEAENAALRAAAQAGAHIYDLVAKWRRPAAGISDGNFVVLIGDAFDRMRENGGGPLLQTLPASNVVAFPKSTQ